MKGIAQAWLAANMIISVIFGLIIGLAMHMAALKILATIGCIFICIVVGWFLTGAISSLIDQIRPSNGFNETVQKRARNTLAIILSVLAFLICLVAYIVWF